ncbi:retrovirus-related pol polyprotein from transposon TNT 1-94 [Tanacetum coccineum]
MQSSSISSDFTSKLLNLENPSLADNEIASLMDTTVRHEEPRSQTSSLYTVPVTTTPEVTSVLTITIPPAPPFFNPLSQHATPTPTPTSLEATTLFLALPDFSFVFKFNDRVTKLETDLTIIKEEVKTQLPQILPKVVSDFATPVIERNVTESLEAAVLAKSSSQPKSTYEAAASLSEFELTKILMDNMEENKSHLRADYKRELYDALVKSYNTDKDLFDTYGNVFTLKKGQDKKDKDQDPSVGSDRGTKRRKLSKEAELPKDPRLKEGKSSSSSKEFDTGNNDEQLDDKVAPKNDWFKKPERPPTPDPDWNKRQHLNITNLTQELLVGPAFNLLKGTCKSLTELEYHFKECSKATTERLDWHNPEGKPYPFDLRKPLPLIPDHRGLQVIPQDYFINNDLEYLKGGSLSRQYSTSVTKIKAATYEIKCIEDMVPNLWSPMKVNQRDLPRDNPVDSVEVLSRHGPSDAMHNPSQPLKVGKTLFQNSQRFTHFYRLSHSELVGIEKVAISSSLRLLKPKSDTYVITMKMEILPVSTSNSTAAVFILNNGEPLVIATVFDERRSVKVKELQERCIIKAFKLKNKEKYEHVGSKVTSAQDGKRSQVDDKGDCIWLMISKCSRSQTSYDKGTSSILKSKITMPFSQDKSQENKSASTRLKTKHSMLVRTFVENGMADGKLCIVSKVAGILFSVAFFFLISIRQHALPKLFHIHHLRELDAAEYEEIMGSPSRAPSFNLREIDNAIHVNDEGDVSICDAEILDELTTSRGELKVGLSLRTTAISKFRKPL